MFNYQKKKAFLKNSEKIQKHGRVCVCVWGGGGGGGGDMEIVSQNEKLEKFKQSKAKGCVGGGGGGGGDLNISCSILMKDKSFKGQMKGKKPLCCHSMTIFKTFGLLVHLQ